MPIRQLCDFMDTSKVSGGDSKNGQGYKTGISPLVFLVPKALRAFDFAPWLEASDFGQLALGTRRWVPNLRYSIMDAHFQIFDSTCMTLRVRIDNLGMHDASGCQIRFLRPNNTIFTSFPGLPSGDLFNYIIWEIQHTP